MLSPFFYCFFSIGGTPNNRVLYDRIANTLRSLSARGEPALEAVTQYGLRFFRTMTEKSMSDSRKVIWAAFLAFFCLFLGGWMVMRGADILLVLIGAIFAASGATFFFAVFFFRK